MDEVPDPGVRAILQKVSVIFNNDHPLENQCSQLLDIFTFLQILSASTTDNLKEIVTENFELLVESGVTNTCANRTWNDKVLIIQSIWKLILQTLG